jgi:outer membrane protein TolC
MKIKITLLLLLLVTTTFAQQVFTNLPSLLKYADSKSISLQSGEIKKEQAHKAKIAAIAGIPDPSGTASFSYTNNSQLPVTLFPANFSDPNAPPGEYNAQRLGLQYNSNLSHYAEIKLFNLQGWQNYKSAKFNIESTEYDDKLTRKTLHENIATTYFNIVQLQEQLKSAQENVNASDTLLLIARAKQKEGIIKPQDVSEVEISYLNSKENVNQIEFMIRQQYTALKTLADIPEQDSISINHEFVPESDSSIPPEPIYNPLQYNVYLMKEKMALANYKKNRYATFPTLSFFGSVASNQYNTQARLFDNNWDWYKSSYIGFKLSAPLPFSANNIASTAESKYNHLLAQKDTESSHIQAELNQSNLRTGYYKARSQWLTDKEIYNLKLEIYLKNKNLYAEGLLETDQILDNFQAVVNSRYSMIQAEISVLLESAKIDINNNIK